MTDTTAFSLSTEYVTGVIAGRVGFISLTRPKALNALDLGMVDSITACLSAWRDDPTVLAVVIRGSDKNGPFGHFCAGGDIRFFHQAALANDDTLETFFTNEYALNHLIHTYPKPYIAFMDGVVMGGGMGIAQGASLRVVTPQSKVAMPETNIGLFPDVGGGFFLSRTPGHIGEYLGLTGEAITAGDAIAAGLADICVERSRLATLWQELQDTPFESSEAVERWVQGKASPTPLPELFKDRTQLDAVFGLPTVADMEAALVDMQGTQSTPSQQSTDGSETTDTAPSKANAWAAHTLAVLRARSPLMMHVVLEQLRKAKAMTLAEDLRMERDMVYQCFHWRAGTDSETVEGIRALAVDKDHQPRWNPSRIDGVTPDMVQAFFKSPWSAEQHPLAHLS
ncbi:MAG: enoyl-CoA hydratase/isomerase family protein [Burkholderiaceae bacterium]|nr:enoyl-CoA hydratase/isomerase family protein [Burkholderiaceae bacterium]